MKVVHKDLQALGVDHESVKKYLKYREADAKVGNDPYTSSASDKATKTKAFRALHKDLESKTKNAMVASQALHNIHDYKGKDSMYESMMSFKSFLEINELSNVTLASYKKKAGEQATAADKAGDFKKGDKRFSGITKATKKQFANPVKEDEDPCWDNYKQLGMKKKNGKKVPNCVPESVDYLFHPLFEAAKAIDSGEYDYEGQMARLQLQTICRNSKDLVDMLSDDENMPEWVQSKITLAQDYISSVRDYLQSKEELGENLEEQFDLIEEVVEELSAEYGIDSEVIWENFEEFTDEELLEYAVDSKGHKSSTGGLTQKGRDSYNAKGGNLQAPVTTPPSKLKPGSKAANRRKSFCARMGGMEGAMEKPNGEPTRKALALRKWNC